MKRPDDYERMIDKIKQQQAAHAKLFKNSPYTEDMLSDVGWLCLVAVPWLLNVLQTTKPTKGSNMRLYLIWQDVNNDYDTYDSAVVCAPNELTARSINPKDGMLRRPSDGKLLNEVTWKTETYGWAHSIDDVKAKYLGEAVEGSERGVVISSYNAG